MSNTELKKTLQERAKQLAQLGYSERKIARELNVSRVTVRRYLNRLRDEVPQERKAAPPANSNPHNFQNSDVYEDHGNTWVKSFITDQPIRTIDDAIKFSGVDVNEWTIKKCEIVHWTTTVKGPNDEPLISQNSGVRLYLERNLRRYIIQSIEELIAEARKTPQVYGPRPFRIPPPSEPVCAVIGLLDTHFGKLSWKPECEDEYDLEIASRIWQNAIVDMVRESQLRRVVRYVIPIGNDLFQSDNKNNTTFKGTHVDCDGRHAKVWKKVKDETIETIDALQWIAPVTVLWVPGNHDETASYYLAEVIATKFAGCPRVAVDTSPTTRKYFEWGVNCIGFDHSDKIPRDRMIGLMQVERPQSWGRTKCHEWIVGHRHHENVYHKNGVTIRQIPSPCGTDAYHYAIGYVGAPKGSQLLYYGYDSGYIGTIFIPARSSAG